MPSRPNPELMVIGDSLPQGCRSLSVTAAFCAQSWPARLAAAQGWEFVTPDFPRPVLFQLEEEILDHLALSALVGGHKLEGFGTRVQANLRAWLRNDRESQFDCFDHLAVAGDLVNDLYSQKASRSQQIIDDQTRNGTSLLDIAHMDIASLHVAINSRFVLNPSQDPGFADFTQLDWVRARLPKRLIVQIGHNHGLYKVGSQATVPHDGVTGGNDGVSYFVQWAELARQLAELPAEVGQVVVCLLPKVGAVANLRPKGADRDVNGYAPAYEPVLAIAPNVLSGAELAAVDASILAANAQIEQLVRKAAAAKGAEGRLKFVSVFDLFEKFDFKNSQDANRRVPIPDRPTVDNLYLDRTLTLHGLQLAAGGFESADGMHASAAGYALLASEVMTALELAHDRDTLLQAAFDDDPLLVRKSPNLDAVVGVLGLIRRTQVDLGLDLPEAAATDQFHIGRIIKMMQSVFDR